MANVSTAEVRQRYRHFRILVIGRANAGKTTLLKRVCNTTEDPCIYDEENNKLLEPTSARGDHDINRPFAFQSNSRFIFHDSPGFEAGDEAQLREVQSFIQKHSQATELQDQLHAIWFCFGPDISRPLLNLEIQFFNEQRAGNVPVIAIFTKFDNLITEVWDTKKSDKENRQIASEELQSKFVVPLQTSGFPPKEFVQLEAMQKNKGTHQRQVKDLIEKTADSLDGLQLKQLFVSVQKNNLELCIRHAIT